MLHRDTARILVIVGPKGGCGKTTFATSLARTLALRNQKCLLVDMSSANQSAAIALNMLPEDLALPAMESGPAATEDPNALSTLPALANRIIPTPFERLSYLSAAIDMDEKTLSALRRLTYDFIIVDMPSGIVGMSLVDAGDMIFLLSTPEPDAIHACTTWLREAMVYRLRSSDEIIPTSPGWCYADLVRALSDEKIADIEYHITANKVLFVLNERREGSEDHQSDALCHAWGRYLGIDVRFAGSLRFEERRWFYTRRCSSDDPLMLDDSIQNDVSCIADKVMAPPFEKRNCLGSLNAIRNAAEFLTVAPNEEPRHAYRRLYEGYRRENGLVSWGIPSDLIRTTMTQLEAAWQHIHNESSAIPIDATPVPTRIAPQYASRRLADRFSAISGYEPSQSDVNAGDWLRLCRENMGMTTAMLAVKTRISTRILEQIERRELDAFSSAHLQAYLFEIAKALSLPLDEVRNKFGFRSS